MEETIQSLGNKPGKTAGNTYTHLMQITIKHFIYNNFGITTTFYKITAKRLTNMQITNLLKPLINYGIQQRRAGAIVLNNCLHMIIREMN